MFTNSLLAVTGALLSVVAAVPMAEHHHHHKREYVWVTHTQEEVVTVPVTKTVWIEPGQTPPTEKAQGYSPPASSSADVEPAATSAAAPPAYTAPVESQPETTSVYVPPTSSSSVYVAPAPTTPTSTYVAPAAPTTYVAPTTSSPAAAASPSADSGSSSSGGSGLSSGMAKAGTSYTGDLTYYEVGLGACGWTNTQDQEIVAISEAIFDSYNNGNPNKNPLCGKYVSITGKDGQQHRAKIVDRCPGCAEADLDLSQDFFNTVTDHGDGRVGGMKWTFE